MDQARVPDGSDGARIPELDGAGVEGLADVLLDLVDDVVQELLARIALDLIVERVEQHHHRRRDDGLLHVVRRDLLVLLDELGRVRLVLERASREARKLTMVPVVEDREVLAVARQVLGQAGARKIG
ncbi:MAG: hypothetical protein KY438_06120, partial [Actinobacteria bacterium]|nr:hypothetical protein [Actinomycetota bacterium]